MLSHSDLEEENDVTIAEFFGSTKPEHAIYAVQMAQLAQLRTLKPTSFNL
jgi:hypothetical protein